MQLSPKENIVKTQKINSGLYIVSTPIGNLSDITLRAIEILKKSDLILCENTRNSAKLLNRFNIKTKTTSYHKFNEKKNLERIVHLLKNDKIISLISDAGTPLISDPGIFLIQECIKNNISLYPVPGPSSIISAISVSGFEGKFLFYGFLPNSENQIKNEIKFLSNFPYSIIFFIPSKRIRKTFEIMKIFFSDRNILIAKEITKIYENFIRSDLRSVDLSKYKLKGELTVIISNKSIIKRKSLNLLDESVKKEVLIMLKKYSVKDVSEFISKKENISKKTIYDFCINQKK